MRSKIYYCDCERYCGGQQRVVSKTTRFNHKQYRRTTLHHILVTPIQDTTHSHPDGPHASSVTPLDDSEDEIPSLSGPTAELGCEETSQDSGSSGRVEELDSTQSPAMDMPDLSLSDPGDPAHGGFDIPAGDVEDLWSQ